uniref:Uncharacterized protein n=1 Tax=Streptomyces sp. NBC_01393 TaxID=2903851 RepID=A0AAU3I9Z2_9ACTN
MREDPLDVLLREGLEDVIRPPEELEDWDLTPVRLALRGAVADRW